MKIEKLTLKRNVIAACVVPLGLVTVAACSSSSAADSSQSQGTQQQQQRQFPGASGTIAEVSGSTMQVQSTQEQTQVTFSSSTKISQNKTVALSDIKVGDCVMATGDASGDSAVSASSVRVSTAENGSCTENRGGMGMGGVPGGGRPSGAPSGYPGGGQRGGPGGEGGPGGGNQNFATAFGKVTAISSGTLQISGRYFSASQGMPSQGATPDQSTQNATITVASGATITKEVSATKSALVVGQCATALGQADDRGVIAATSITVSAPTNGSCNRRFGAGGPGAGASGNPNG